MLLVNFIGTAHLERLIEEVLHAGGQIAHKSERVADNVEAENQHVELLNELSGVVSLHFGLQLLAVVEVAFALEVGQSESK